MTENTRAAYPVDFIENAVIPGVGSHPRNVMFLAADAFGVLPPIARLTPEQAMYHFLSGYTAKLPAPKPAWARIRCRSFRLVLAPFLPLAPRDYAEMLGKRLKQHNASCWLVNTGWSGGKFGVGKRMSIRIPRALVNAALNGGLDKVEFVTEPAFGLHIPVSCPGGSGGDLESSQRMGRQGSLRPTRRRIWPPASKRTSSSSTRPRRFARQDLRPSKGKQYKRGLDQAPD